MGTIADKLEYLNDTKTAIKGALQNRGVTVSDADTFRSYADKVGQIGETVEKTKFCASIDTFIGDVDADGTLNKTTWTGALNFAGVKTISSNGLQYAFYDCPGLTSVDLSSLQSINNNGLQYAFYGCIGLTSVDLSSLQSINDNGLQYAFYGCPNLTSVDLSSLQSINNNGLQYAFYDCPGLTSVDLSSLQSIGYSGMYHTFDGCIGLTGVDLSSLQSVGQSGLKYAFYYCPSLTTISFPSLTSVQTDSFGSSTSNSAFRDCIALAEIHFRADMQTTIEAMSQYENKWGATNASVIFDL